MEAVEINITSMHVNQIDITSKSDSGPAFLRHSIEVGAVIFKNKKSFEVRCRVPYSEDNEIIRKSILEVVYGD